MSWQSDLHSPESPRRPGVDSHDLELMAFEQPSPDDITEAVILMRRWTRLSDSLKPELHFRYMGIGSRSKMGFLAWLVDTHRHLVYSAFRDQYPVEAAAFRLQLLTLCESRKNRLSRTNGSGLVYVFASALAKHAAAFPKIALGEE